MDSRVSTFANFSALVKELFPSIAKPRYRDKTAARTQSMARQGQSLRIEKPVTVPAPRRGRGGGGGGNLKRMFGMAGQALTSLMPLPASATSHDIARQQYGRTVNLHPEEYPFG
jgi:S-adenosylmethionine synthetase